MFTLPGTRYLIVSGFSFFVITFTSRQCYCYVIFMQFIVVCCLHELNTVSPNITKNLDIFSHYIQELGFMQKWQCVVSTTKDEAGPTKAKAVEQ